MDNNSLKCFVSYSHRDKNMFNKFNTHVGNLKRSYNLQNWHDGMILPGDDIDKEIAYNLKTADIVFLLVSPDYINSYYCYDKELKIAIKRHSKNECIVIPVIIRDYVSGNYPFNNLNFVPADGRPIDTFRTHNKGFVNAFTAISKLLEKFFGDKEKLSVMPKRAINKNTTQKAKEKKTNDKNSENIIKYSLIKNGKLRDDNELNQEFFNAFLLYTHSLSHFMTDINTLSIKCLSSLSQLINSKTRKANVLSKGKINIQSFLMQLFTYMQKQIIGVDNTYVHYRVEKQDVYKTFFEVGYLVYKLSKEPIPSGSSMIGCSKRLQQPVIKRFNVKLHKENHPNETIFRDYITFTFDEISKLYNVNISMCISVIGRGQHRCKDLFIPMAIARFDKVIEKCLIQYIESCMKLNKNYNIKEILEGDD